MLEAAESVLDEQGLSARMDEIARRAGVGVGTVYRHFATKEALYQAIVTGRQERMRTAIADLLDRAQRVGAVRSDIGVPEVLALLRGASMAGQAFHTSWLASYISRRMAGTS